MIDYILNMVQISRGCMELQTEEMYSQFEEHRHMGFGLGLAMCKMAVKLHNGRIWADTVVPAGSRFVFTLPRATV